MPGELHKQIVVAWLCVSSHSAFLLPVGLVARWLAGGYPALDREGGLAAYNTPLYLLTSFSIWVLRKSFKEVLGNLILK